MQLFFSTAMTSLIASPTFWLIAPSPSLAQAPTPVAGSISLPRAPAVSPVPIFSIDEIRLPGDGEQGGAHPSTQPRLPQPQLPLLAPLSGQAEAAGQGASPGPVRATPAPRPAISPLVPGQGVPRRLLLIGLEPILPLPAPGEWLPLPPQAPTTVQPLQRSQPPKPPQPHPSSQRPQPSPEVSFQQPYPSFGNAAFDQQLRRYLLYTETLGRPDILIVGDDRARQGINPLVLQASLGDRGYDTLRVFNWGLDNASAQTVEVLLRDVLTGEQLPQLVLWAASAPALNGGQPDRDFERLVNSPGYRQLQQGQAPHLSPRERQGLQPQRQLLAELQAEPIAMALPEGLKSFGQLAQQTALRSGSTESPGTESRQAKSRQADSSQAASLQDLASAPAASALAASAPRPQPALIRDRAALLPILRPQPQLDASPGVQSTTASQVAQASQASQGIAPSPPITSQPQSAVSRFRLVNWCRSLNGPCQPDSAVSAAELPAAVAPIVPNKARSSSLGQFTAEPPQPPISADRSAKARASQPVPELPAWQLSDRQRRSLSALGFQADDRRFAPPTALTRQQLRRGDEDDQYRNFSLQGTQNQAFYRTLQWGQASGITIAFLPLPVSQAYLDSGRDRHHQAFQTYLEVADQMTPLHLIQLKQAGHANAWGDEHFADASHLNSRGAAVLSWQLGQSLDPDLLKLIRH